MGGLKFYDNGYSYSNYLYSDIHMKGMPYPHVTHYLQISLDAIGTACF